MSPVLRSLLPLLLAVPLSVQAGESRPQLSSRQCGFSTSYDVLADTGGIWLHRKQGEPQEIFFHDGRLSVDQQVRQVSEADAQRLRQLEAGARALMPAVADIARETVDIVFDAFAGVVEAMTGSKRKARALDDYRERALAQIDGSLGKGRWDQEVFDERFEANIEQAADAMAGSVVRSALFAVFTGGADRLERRSEAMEKALDQRMEARSRSLEARARTLCGQVEALHALQQSLEFRLDGQPLHLLDLEAGHEAGSYSAALGGAAGSALRAAR
ncbi:MAG: DUF2884 family protein [Gammaproteobacteria bacterium]|uniref:DUF2884 family protein n=1 Tax=Pseudomonas sp. Hp2 TaxID=701189 RepID=UPI0011267F2F|nr:DUF2884 family protein [Pseudomonas sp. Hp2]